MKRNRYSRALKHLKSTELDEKLQRLNEGPTNSIGGVYALNPPGFRVGIPDPPKVYYPDADGNWPAGIPGTPGELSYTRPEGYWSGGSDWNEQISTDFTQNYLLQDPTGRSTSGLIAEDGTVLAQLPPGGQNFILGPIVDGYIYNHGYDDYTNIGYIQKDTRQFVLLARIQGHWSADLRPSGRTPRAWNGTSGQLTIYNQNFTLAMAEWIRDEILANKYTSNVPYFYSGGVPQVPQSAADCPDCPPGMYGGNGVGGRPFGRGGNPNIGTKQGNPTKGGPGDANLWGLNYKTGKKEKLSAKDYAAYKAGGGDAAAKKGKSIKEIIAQGKKNLGQYDSGPRRTSSSMNDFRSAAEFSAYKAGGGDAALKAGNTRDQIIQQGIQNIGKTDSGPRRTSTSRSDFKTYSGLDAYIRGTTSDYDAYKAGGGDAAVKAGKTRDQVISQGIKNINTFDPNYVPPSAKNILDRVPSYKNTEWGKNLDRLQNDPVWGPLIDAGLGAISMGVGKGVGIKPPSRGLSTKGLTVGATGLDYKGFQAITQGKPYVPSSKPQILGKGAYSAPKVGKVGGPLGGTGGAKYSGTQGSLGGTKQPGGVVQTIVPGGARRISVIEPQAKVPSQTFDKGAELARKLADPNYRSGSALADRLRQQATQAGFKPGQTSIPYSELPKVTGTGKVGAAIGAGVGVAALDAGEAEGGFRIKPSWTVQQSTDAARGVSDFQTILQDTRIGLGKGYSFDDLQFKKSGAQVTVLKDGKPVMYPNGKPATVTFHSIDKDGNFTAHGSGNKTAGNNLRTVMNQIKEMTPASQTGKVSVTTTKPGSAEKTKYTEFKSGSGPKPKTGTQSSFSSFSKTAGKVIKFSHELEGQLISESHRRILREIKQPLKIEEPPTQKLKNYRPNFAGKYTPQNTPDVTASKKSDDMVKAQNAAGQAWRTNDKYWKGYETTERMNIIYDNVGHGSQYWDMIISENQRKKGWRDREVQEQLNLIAHEKAMIKENPQYQSPFQIEIEEQETMKYDKDPLFRKVKNKLKTEIDYPDKPSKLGYPNNPPPEQVDGWHSEYGERDSYYNSLDPQSANAMPPTGNPKIDAKVEKAKRIKSLIKKK